MTTTMGRSHHFFRTFMNAQNWALVLSAVRLERRTAWGAAGLVFGLAYWTRPEGLGYVGLVPILVITDHWIRHRH